MSVEVNPFAIEALTYNAEVTRRAIYMMLARGATIGSVAGGLVAATDCQLIAGSGMAVNVSAGEAVVPGSTSATQSGYYSRVSSSSVLAIAASDPTNPRIDRISLVIKDAAYSGAANELVLAVETGTPTSGATLANKETHGVAAAPASSLTLGYCLVPAKAASIVSGDIENVATVLDLGLIATLIGADSVGTTQLAAESVTEAKLAKALLTGAWTAITPGGKGEAFTGVGLQSPACRLENGGQVVRLRGFIKAVSEIGAGNVVASIPSAFKPPAGIWVPSSTFTTLGETVSPTVLEISGTAITARVATTINRVVSLEGITFNLT